MEERLKISIVGSGKVATQLLRHFSQVNIHVADIYGRNSLTTNVLSKKFNIPISVDINDIKGNMIIICVNDSAIDEIVQSLNLKDRIVLHTSGTLSSKLLSQKFYHWAVFYPLQTISYREEFNFSETPFLINASDDHTYMLCKNLAQSIKGKPYKIDDIQREKIHLAAVITNNFMNHLAKKSYQFLTEANVNYEILIPLIKRTLQKITEPPFDFTQTGPATRNDQEVIQKHIDALSFDPDLQSIYQFITNSIQNYENHS